ncbi:hypothetical protein [Aminipila sp.]|uniref:hypothetical protein n=1 Tax=Aminipila sp. TaxID=2060095 RepID=UPI00289E7CD8|nr:hypothetical protein [Aminipila sp.]
MKKKFITVLASICLVLSMFTVSVADIKDNDVAQLIPGEENTVEITYNEYINLMAKANGITKSEAIARDKQDTSNKISNIMMRSNGLAPKSSGTKYYKASKTFTYSGNKQFKAKSEATIKLMGAGSMYEITDVTGVWTVGVDGLYAWEWNQLSAWTSGQTQKRVDIGGSGVFTVTRGLSGGVSVPLDGFSISGSVSGQTKYTSKSMQMSWTWGNPYIK